MIVRSIFAVILGGLLIIVSDHRRAQSAEQRAPEARPPAVSKEKHEALYRRHIVGQKAPEARPPIVSKETYKSRPLPSLQGGPEARPPVSPKLELQAPVKEPKTKVKQQALGSQLHDLKETPLQEKTPEIKKQTQP
jgi:hypothetical protein